MAIDADQWDFSNKWTNNIFAMIFFISILCNRLMVNHGNTMAIYLIDFTMGISIADLIDKFIRGVRTKTESDNYLLALSITMPLLLFALEYYKPQLKLWIAYMRSRK